MQWSANAYQCRKWKKRKRIAVTLQGYLCCCSFLLFWLLCIYTCFHFTWALVDVVTFHTTHHVRKVILDLILLLLSSLLVCVYIRFRNSMQFLMHRVLPIVFQKFQTWILLNVALTFFCTCAKLIKFKNISLINNNHIKEGWKIIERI